MKKKFLHFLLAFFTALPLIFTVICFGYLPLQFDAVIYTDNIVGEGTCSNYLADSETNFSYLYEQVAYFGSEMKTLRLSNLRSNVEIVELRIFDIEEADILSFDISVFGRTVTHISKSGVTHPFTKTTQTAVVSDEEPLFHITMDQEQGVFTVRFPGNSVIPRFVWIVYYAGILALAALLALLLMLLFERLPALQIPLISASGIMLTMLMGCFICRSLDYVDYTCFLLNWLVFCAAALLIDSLTLPRLGTALVSLFTLFWYSANYFVILYRAKPVMPADLKAIKTANEVIGGYNLTPTWKMIVSVLVVIGFLVMLFLAGRSEKDTKKRPVRRGLIRRGCGVLAALAIAFFCVNNPAFRNLNSFQWDANLQEGFHREGIALTFIKSAMSGHVKRPDGYSREALAAYLTEYQKKTEPDGVQPTRIIMVMDEAFADLRTVGLDERIDVMPFIDSLDENTIEGRLYVSVTGGGTCNTEFEGLTGNTLAFLGPGAYPYTENVTKAMFSLASYFRDSGYLTEAFHANNPQNWNRDIVYPNLGFGTFHAKNDYPMFSPEKLLHGYCSDATDFAFVMQRDMETEGSSKFLFNVTIQNHSPYDRFEDVQQAETLAPFEEELHQTARVYLSLIRASDEAVRQLVEQYEDSEEPTMIVFFGDHQPLLSPNVQKQLYTSVQTNLDYYKSKFFIWTNYETETVHDAALSANYLPWLILDRGHFPLPPYVQMLKELHEKYPIISSQGVMDAEGNVYDNVAMLLDDPLIQKYQYVQYANLFDEIDEAWFKTTDR